MQSVKDAAVLSVRAKDAIGTKQYSQLQDIAQRYVGTIEKYSDDAIFILFGVFESYKDDKERAIDAAGELRHRFPKLRIGISAGDVDIQNYKQMDSTVHEALELANAAEPGRILINERLYQLVKEPLVCIPRTKPMQCHEITGVSDKLKSAYKPSRPSERSRQKKRQKSKSSNLFSTRVRQRDAINKWWNKYVRHIYRSVVGIAIIGCILLLWYLARC